MTALRTFRERAVPAPGRTAPRAAHTSGIRLGNAVPATMVCCSFPSEVVQAQVQAGAEMFAPVADLTDVSYVDLPTGHWPMWSRPPIWPELIAATARSGSGRLTAGSHDGARDGPVDDVQDLLARATRCVVPGRQAAEPGSSLVHRIRTTGRKGDVTQLLVHRLVQFVDAAPDVGGGRHLIRVVRHPQQGADQARVDDTGLRVPSRPNASIDPAVRTCAARPGGP